MIWLSLYLLVGLALALFGGFRWYTYGKRDWQVVLASVLTIGLWPIPVGVYVWYRIVP